MTAPDRNRHHANKPLPQGRRPHMTKSPTWYLAPSTNAAICLLVGVSDDTTRSATKSLSSPTGADCARRRFLAQIADWSGQRLRITS